MATRIRSGIRSWIRPASAATTITALLLLATAAFAGPAAAEPAEQPPAWSVATVDSDRGAGRPNFAYDVNPGDAITDTIRVANTGASALTLTIYAADAFTTESGAVDILENGEQSVDAGTWVVPGVGSVSLEPGATADVPFTVTVPGDATPGDHSAALVASLLPGDGGGQVQVERRLGLRVDLRVSGAVAPTAEIRGLTTEYSAAGANPFGGGIVRVTYELVNTGNVRLATLEDLRMSGFANTSPIAMTGSEVPELLPGSAVTVTRDVTTSAIGPIDGSLTLYLQPVGAFTEQPVAVTAPISALSLPWSLIIGIVVLLLVVAGVIFWLLRRRRIDRMLAALDEEDARGGQHRASVGAGATVALVAAVALGLSLGDAAPATAAPSDPGHTISVEIPAATAVPTVPSMSPTTPTTSTSSSASTTPAQVAPGSGTSGGTGTGQQGAGPKNLANTGADEFGVFAALSGAALATGAALLLLGRRRPAEPRSPLEQ